MLHHQAQAQLLALAEGRLDAGARQRLEEHLAGCPRCRADLEDVVLARRRVRELPAARLPDAASAAIRGAIRERLAAREQRESAWAWLWPWAAPVSAVVVLAVGLSLTTGIQATDDWPQWRGPGRDGKSADRGLLASWPAGGPPLAWQAEGLGAGYASVSVAGGRIFTLGDFGDEQAVVALDRDGGRRLWTTRIGPSWKGSFVGPRATPTVDGSRVYAMSTDGVVVCLDAESGTVLWRKSLPESYGAQVMRWQGRRDWRFSESPLVDGPRVVVTPGAPDAALVALDKRSGEEIWRAPLPELGEHGSDGAGYASAVISHGGGIRQYVQLLGRGLIGVEAATGRTLWGYNRIANDVANIATPLVDGDRVFVASGFGRGAVLLRLIRRGAGIEAREEYYLPPDVMQSELGGMVLVGGHVYAAGGSSHGAPQCLDLASGEKVWGPEADAGRPSAAVAFADGRLYFRYQDGRMLLVDAAPEGYRERGRFTIPGVSRESWSHPVIAGGILYLREQDRLYAYDVRATSATL